MVDYVTGYMRDKNMTKYNHVPVMVNEIIENLDIKDNDICIDCTFGAGGYSKAVLELYDCTIYAIDCDTSVLKFFNVLKDKYQDNIHFIHSKFSKVAKIIKEKGINSVDHIFFDLGVSSMQIDEASRGFSFMRDGDLDMRMDKSRNVTAKNFVNDLSETEIADYIYMYGDERHSRKIAKAIVEFRKDCYIKTTLELANIIRSVIKRGKSNIDPATKTFQAIRIWVNDELNELTQAIISLSEVLAIKGRMAIVTFHSGEDRIVKNIFKQLENKGDFQVYNKKIILPSTEEIKSNVRSRSSKLRIIERVR